MSDPNIDPNKPVTTGVPIPADEPVRILSKLHGDEANAIVFNLKYIEAHNPALAEEIRQLYEAVKDISPDDELDGHEEDIALVDEMFQKLAQEAKGHKKI